MRPLPESPHLPHALYRAAQVRALDRTAIEIHGIPGIELMERAGAAAYGLLRARWPGHRNLTVLAGAGNNGGDGYVVARLARAEGLRRRGAPARRPGSADAGMPPTSSPPTGIRAGSSSPFGPCRPVPGSSWMPCSAPVWNGPWKVPGPRRSRRSMGPARRCWPSISPPVSMRTPAPMLGIGGAGRRHHELHRAQAGPLHRGRTRLLWRDPIQRTRDPGGGLFRGGPVRPPDRLAPAVQSAWPRAVAAPTRATSAMCW